jgi:MFS family permease
MRIRPLTQHLIPPSGPIRVLAASNLARTTGNGILVSVVVLYFTRSVGLSAGQMGLGLSLAAGLGMLASIPAGHAADVLGARNTAMVFVALQGVMICGYALVGGFVAFLVTASLVVMSESGADASRGALVAGVVPQGERVRARAYLRSITNIGISIGAVFGGLGLHYNTRLMYVALLLACGLLFIGASLIYLVLPPVPPLPKPDEGPRLLVLRDKPFVVIALINALLVMNGGILTVALPLWIAERTNAPTSLYAVILLINTITVVLFQVRASRGAEDVAGGARALRRSGVLLAACCALFALAANQPAWLAVVILVTGTLVHVFGELLYSAGSWALSYELAPEHAQGQYQGLFAMTVKLGTMLTPVVATTLVIGKGWPGWLVFAVVLMAAGMAAPPAARWAEYTRASSLALLEETGV